MIVDRRLRRALDRDDRREDEGMHADDRVTCHQCQSWADHAHEPLSNRVITLEQYAEIVKRRGF